MSGQAATASGAPCDEDIDRRRRASSRSPDLADTRARAAPGLPLARARAYSTSNSRGVSPTDRPSTNACTCSGSIASGPTSIVCDPSLAVRLHPAQVGADPRQQLLHREGLGDVVVGAHLEAVDAVELARARCRRSRGRAGPRAAAPRRPATRRPAAASGRGSPGRAAAGGRAAGPGRRRRPGASGSRPGRARRRWSPRSPRRPRRSGRSGAGTGRF